MQYLSNWDTRNIRLAITDTLYSGEAQSIRIEWYGTDTDEGSTYVARTGGSVDSLTTGFHRGWGQTAQTVDGSTWYLFTETGVAAQIHVMDEFDAKRYENLKVAVGDVLIYVATSLNLNRRERLHFVQLLDNEKVSGTGIGSGAVWTDSEAVWTTDQYQGYDLVFSDRRFPILSNTGTVLTVELNGFSLPASGSYTIQPVIEYMPKIINPDIGDGLNIPIGDEIPLQVILCNKASQSGDR